MYFIDVGKVTISPNIRSGQTLNTGYKPKSFLSVRFPTWTFSISPCLGYKFYNLAEASATVTYRWIIFQDYTFENPWRSNLHKNPFIFWVGMITDKRHHAVGSEVLKTSSQEHCGEVLGKHNYIVFLKTLFLTEHCFLCRVSIYQQCAGNLLLANE